MAVFGTRSVVFAQLANAARFRAAFDFLDRCFEPGSPERATVERLAPTGKDRIELPAGAFALIEAYLTRRRDESRWETHGAHIDVQTILEGIEMTDIAPRERMEVEEDLTPARDVMFYRDRNPAGTLFFTPGDVGIYYPTDAHRGALAIAGPVFVRKIVVKVPVGK